ncbi:hypothetical protein PMAYCL1PPCAC_14854, partial [Pristionchus mayeri]
HSFFKEMKSFRDAWHGQCNFTLHYPGLIEKLRNENYDGAFSEPVCMCGFALFNLIGIKNYAISLSISSSEGTFDSSGAPSFPSYIPSTLGIHGERMSFFERLHNLFNHLAVNLFYPGIRDPFDEMFRQRFGKEAKGVDVRILSSIMIFQAILRNSSFYFVNAEPLIDFPKMLTHKVIDIGGISVSSGHNPINEFPDVTFIWKYEKPEDKIREGIDNLIESTGTPQNDLMYDPRLSLFITHCGQGSTIEAVTAGVPLIVIPILGDRQRNAQVIKRIGTGIMLEKTSLVKSEELVEAIGKMLNTNEFSNKARLVGEMIRNRPFTAPELFVKNMEFMARFGPLRSNYCDHCRQLDHYGQQLNFFQYYLIDVLAFL